jgi:O-antigen ligase
VLLLALPAGLYLRTHSLSFRELVVFTAIIVGVIAIQLGEWGIRIGFVAWVCTLGLGYRTAHLTPNLSVHPAEIVLWGLLTLLLLRRFTLRQGRGELWLPRWLWWFAPFWVWAWWCGLQAGEPWDKMLAEFRCFLLLLPLFCVATTVLAKERHWRSVLLAFYGVGAWIAGLGILEFVDPGLVQLLPGFSANATPIVTDGGFLRAPFSFWGTPDAIFICGLTFPLTVVVWRWYTCFWQRALTLGIVALHVAAIYISGHRDVWLALALVVGLYVWRRRGAFVALLGLCIALQGVQLLPEATQNRLGSLTLLLQAKPNDSSGTKRVERLQGALEAASDQPLGRGWAGAGWVHSDFLQVAVNMGVLGGLFFAGAYLVTLWRLWSRVRAQPRRKASNDLGHALLLSFITAGILLAMDCLVVLPQLVLPVWLVWVTAEIWLRQTSQARKTTGESSSYFYPPADLQFGRDRASHLRVGQVGR